VPTPWPIRTYEPSRPLTVFCGGKAEYRKGQDLVLEYLAGVVETMPPDARMDVVLSWASPWPHLAASLADGVTGDAPALLPDGRLDVVGWAQRHVPPHPGVRWVDAGLVSPRFRRRWYTKADVGVQLSRVESGTNLVAMELLASGVPVVLSRGTGHDDLESPILLRPEDVRSYDVLVAVAQINGSDAARAFQAEWSWDRRGDAMLDVIADVIA
jgi:glycosyltransferase involved in cell wall biosynthesis